MKRYVLSLCCMAVMSISCESSGARNYTGENERNLFNRETFDLERQSWLAQGFQNYSFYQHHLIPSGAESTIQFIKNGEPKYFRYVEFDRDTHTEYIGKELHKMNGRMDILLSDRVSISLTSLYVQIDDLAKGGKYKIYLEYDSRFHYPTYIFCNGGGGTSFYLYLRDLIVNPAIPDESSAIDAYPTGDIN